MAFLSRVTHLRPEGTYAVFNRVLELEAQGYHISHLEMGQPDFPTPEHVGEAGIKAIRAGKTRYTSRRVSCNSVS